MTVIVVGSAGFDLTEIDFAGLLDGDVITRSASIFSLDLGGGETITFAGSGFMYDGSDRPAGGTVTGLSWADDGETVFEASGFAVPAATFVSWIENGRTDEALKTLLAGSDTLTASDGFGAALFALDGDDLIIGGASDDVLDGGAGDNTIFGGDGNDLMGAPEFRGSNHLRGGQGEDLILGGSGDDDVNGNQGDDLIDGGGGMDSLRGGRGDDRIFAESGDVFANGNLGADVILAGTGSDTLHGGQGDDILLAWDGDDQLFGDQGDDSMAGGPGADAFHFLGDSGRDVIADFAPEQGDRIRLAADAAYTLRQDGDDAVLDLGDGDQVTLLDVRSSTFSSAWVVLA